LAEWREASGKVAAELQKYANLAEVGPDKLKLYSGTINSIVGDPRNRACLLRTFRDVYRKGPPSKSPPINAADGWAKAADTSKAPGLRAYFWAITANFN
jgi:hypothetical protein